MVDARTPVIVGVGQSAENIGDSSYRGSGGAVGHGRRHGRSRIPD